MHKPNLDVLHLLTKAELIAIIKKMLTDKISLDSFYSKGAFHD